TTPAQQAKPKPPAQKKSTVWTNDNIDSALSPSDAYQIQEAQERQAQQAAQQRAAVEAKIPSPPPGFVKPETAQQARQLLAEAQNNLKSQQEYVQQTQKELATAPDSYKERLQWRIKSRTDVIKKLQSDIAALEKDRDALAKTPAADNASANNSGSLAQP
ncbi:MAG: hypothetical protein ACRD4X_16510, partial [Candidatus Acidiferrales bacterium]